LGELGGCESCRVQKSFSGTGGDIPLTKRLLEDGLGLRGRRPDEVVARQDGTASVCPFIDS
jgi:hypothetical protein